MNRLRFSYIFSMPWIDHFSLPSDQNLFRGTVDKVVDDLEAWLNHLNLFRFSSAENWAQYPTSNLWVTLGTLRRRWCSNTGDFRISSDLTTVVYTQPRVDSRMPHRWDRCPELVDANQSFRTREDNSQSTRWDINTWVANVIYFTHCLLKEQGSASDQTSLLKTF